MTGVVPMQGTAPRTDYAARARQVREQYEREVAGINGDPAMHPAARRIRLAKAFTTATGQLRELEAGADRARLFRTAADHAGAWQSADALAGRDARDRAARITTADAAARAINEAHAAGDDDLVKAIAHRAVRLAVGNPDGDFGEVASQYLQASGLGASVRKVSAQHGAEVAVEKGKFWLPVPDQLRGMHDFEIHALGQRDVAGAVAAATAPQRAAWDAANLRSGNRASV